MSLVKDLPPLSSVQALQDFEDIAKEHLKAKSFAYYHGPADNGDTMRRNSSVFSLVRFRPRVLKHVTDVDLSTSIFGVPSSAPFFIGPAALGRLAHPDGELCIVRSAGKAGIIYGPSYFASTDHEEMANAKLPGQNLIYQLYANPDREKVVKDVKRAKDLGYKAVLVTIDAPVPGKREEDERVSFDPSALAVATNFEDADRSDQRNGTVTRNAHGIDSALIWKDISLIRNACGLPVILKGIQTVEDAARAVDLYGVEGIMLSNHGGRQLNSTNTPLEVLLEIRRYRPDILTKTQVVLDSGARSGAHLVAGLCLGARAVSFARPFMFSLIYGDEGVKHGIELLKTEIIQTMRLLGASSLSELTPDMVNATRLEEQVSLEAKL